MAFYVVMCH